MATLTAHFSAHRAVRQYTTEYYLPAAAAYGVRRADRSAVGVQMTNWRRALEEHWHSISFGAMQVETNEEQHYFRVEVDFGGVDPEAVLVELYAEPLNGHAFRQPMVRGDKSVNREQGYEFLARVPATRPAGDFTPRIIPNLPGVAVPLEMPLILWHH
jgi:starch phosphorylase